MASAYLNYIANMNRFVSEMVKKNNNLHIKKQMILHYHGQVGCTGNSPSVVQAYPALLPVELQMKAG